VAEILKRAGWTLPVNLPAPCPANVWLVQLSWAATLQADSCAAIIGTQHNELCDVEAANCRSVLLRLPPHNISYGSTCRFPHTQA
jgi:hypothetical protein